MRGEDDIAYADKPLIKVMSARALDDHRLSLRFSTGEEGVFDAASFLDKPAFAPLLDQDAFRSVYVDYGTVVWEDGAIDIDPECLYEGCGFALTDSPTG